MNKHVDNVILSICIIYFPFLEFSMILYEFLNLSFESRVYCFVFFWQLFCSSPKQTLKIEIKPLKSPNLEGKQFMICWTFWYKEHQKRTYRLARMNIWNLTVQKHYEQYQFIRKIRNKCYKNLEKYQTCSFSSYKHSSMIWEPGIVWKHDETMKINIERRIKQIKLEKWQNQNFLDQ